MPKISEALRVASSKLSRSIIDKICEENTITDSELDLLLYLGGIQDVFGNVKGIYYKDVCETLNYCKQSFYNALKGLEVKGYIVINIEYKEKNYWECTILDNVFSSDKDDRKSYLNVNKQFFASTEFRTLKLNEKKLCIKLYMSILKPGLSIFPDKIKEWLSVKSNSVIWSYLKNIKPLFSYSIKPTKTADKLFFAFNIELDKAQESSEREVYLRHRIKYLLKKQKICYSPQDIADLITLLGQFASVGIGKIISVICHVIEKKKKIEGKLINSLLNDDSGEFPELYTS